MHIYVQESLPEISRELEMYQRGPCVILNICMFHGWLPPSQRLLFGKAFALLLVVFVGFLQPRRSSGRNPSLSDYIAFVSKAIICNLPSPTNPRESILLKTYITEACVTFLLPGKLCRQHIQWQRRWAPSKSQTECIRDQTSATSASHAPLRGQTSQGFQIAGVLQL